MGTDTEMLGVPYGMDEAGRLVRPSAASRDRAYRCPKCRAPLVLKAGPVRVTHFSHGRSGPCDPDSVVRWTAMRLVVQGVHEWKSGDGPAPTVERYCGRCGVVEDLPLPERVKSAAVESPGDDSDARVADVALLDEEGRTVGLVAIVGVGERSCARSPARAVPCAELDAWEVLQEPLVWRPLDTTAREYVCDSCHATAREQRRRLADVARRNRQPLPGPPYRAAVYCCWSCGEDTLVYTWSGHVPWTRTRPPEPRPRTVRWRFSWQIEESYWANNCARCGAIQGDFYLFHDEDGPFVEAVDDPPVGAGRPTLVDEALDILFESPLP
ncbi:MAG: hypothetical protein ACQEXJ_21445 [Myxococcota bacterium]